ncbi:MAG: hypothetical protein Q8R83_03740 [Legionellaceae bacterium]|nr:hypothetical protein [Legionellaceae bacterium]
MNDTFERDPQDNSSIPVAGHWATIFSPSELSLENLTFERPYYIPIDGLKYIELQRSKNNFFEAFSRSRNTKLHEPLDFETLRNITLRQIKNNLKVYESSGSWTYPQALSDVLRKTIIILKIDAGVFQEEITINDNFLDKSDPIFIVQRPDKYYDTLQVTGDRVISDILRELRIVNVSDMEEDYSNSLY